MKTVACFKKGDMVRVVNPNNHFYDDIAEIVLFDNKTNKYLLEFSNRYKCFMYHHDIVKHLNRDEQRKLQKAHLLQIADLALEFNDKAWFDDAMNRFELFT